MAFLTFPEVEGSTLTEANGLVEFLLGVSCVYAIVMLFFSAMGVVHKRPAKLLLLVANVLFFSQSPIMIMLER